MDPAALASLTIYNLPPAPPKWDRIGIFYITFCAAWTALVAAGMAFCWANRASPVLRLRGLPLSFTAIACLHAYWILAQITYPVGGTMPVVLAYDVQYFVMGLWFPLGIALFHASNSRFLHVAKLQRLHFAGAGHGHGHGHGHGFGDGTSRRGKVGCDGSETSWLCRLRNMSYTKRIMIPIGLGLIAQVLLTIGMWLACKKYHPSFGIPGTEIRGSNLMEQLEELGRGWEWWPSVLWQVIWTWIVAPIMIWRAWGIRDTMGWRTQTVGCCLSGLHATPMFLVASYVPAFAKVNPYFTPSQWIHLSSMMFEIFTVFVPAFQVVRLRILSKHAADSNAKWETASQASTLRPASTIVSWYGNQQKRATIVSQAEKGFLATCQSQSQSQSQGQTAGSGELGPEPDSRLLTMSALDHALRENQAPLQEFSALSDFSGENIAFLSGVAAWKSSTWPELPAFSMTSQSSSSSSSPSSSAEKRQSLSDEEMLDAYNRALEIYADFVSPQHAEFPLNLPSQELKNLEAVFDKPARILFGDDASVNPATPFDDAAHRRSQRHQHQQGSRTGSSSGSEGQQQDEARGQIRYTGEVPAGFEANVFDAAQSHVKYLVLTNTWPKFVREMHQQRRRQSGETGHSVLTSDSQTSLLSRVSSRLSGFFHSAF